MAQEVGIDREAVEEATAELAQTRADELVRQTQAVELAQERARQLSRFVGSLVTFLVVGALLYFIDRKFIGGAWYFWALLAWSIPLVLRLRGVLFPQRSLERHKLREARRADRQERRAARHQRKQRIRAAWENVGSPAAMNEGAREFEHAVQAGVAALLSVAARKITDRATRTAAGQTQVQAQAQAQKGPARRL
jgi:hypothetical protein